jgi:hypothetical protein
MNLPGFTATAALGRPRQTYRARNVKESTAQISACPAEADGNGGTMVSDSEDEHSDEATEE